MTEGEELDINDRTVEKRHLSWSGKRHLSWSGKRLLSSHGPQGSPLMDLKVLLSWTSGCTSGWSRGVPQGGHVVYLRVVHRGHVLHPGRHVLHPGREGSTLRRGVTFSLRERDASA